MSIIKELYGYTLTASGAGGATIRQARCPHMNNRLCDGGGNRDMMRWPATGQPLAPLFDPSVGREGGGFIPCGVCSVETGREQWAVCPRRLLALDAINPSPQQRSLRDRVLKLAGFHQGETVRIWSEVTLKDKHVNYCLDYILRNGSAPPCIVEIMTASTSGGDRKKGTDMQSAFCDAVLYATGLLPERRNSPGVNRRQVWGARMASQMIVKSEIANEWGGRAIWVVQDTLMSYIRAQTGLKLDMLRSASWEAGDVNVISASLTSPSDFSLYSGPAHGRFPGEACWTDLLSAPAIPHQDVLAKKLTDETMAASFTVQEDGP